jgi:sigma-E factor negative regulatory protein RseB
MRHSLLLTAVTTVTIPGLLAGLAVRAHEHVAAETGGATAAAAAVLSGPLPVAPASARASVRNNVAGAEQAGGMPLTVLSSTTGSEQARGMSMLGQAAAAGLATSYVGTEVVSQTELGGDVSTVTQVWHQGGGGTMVQSSTDPADADLDAASPEGVFGVTKDLVAMLGQHYAAMYLGGGSVVGRPAAIVELYRPDGSLAASYWLDKQTMVPLRRELFDASERVVSQDAFTRVRFGALSGCQVAAVAWQAQATTQSAWVAAASPAGFLASLARAGWQLPGRQPDNLPLYRAASGRTASGEVVDLEYSDGLYDVSLFVEQGTLASDMSGWQRVTVDGQQAYASGHSVTWAASGLVYTVIADAPPHTVAAFMAAVPRRGSAGFLGRLGRGFERLGRLVDPFA